MEIMAPKNHDLHVKVNLVPPCKACSFSQAPNIKLAIIARRKMAVFSRPEHQ